MTVAKAFSPTGCPAVMASGTSASFFFFFFLCNLIDCVCTTDMHSTGRECRELHPAGIKKHGKRGKKRRNAKGEGRCRSGW